MTTPHETAPNPHAFIFTCQGKQQFADPLRVRRALLDHTLGKCWGILRKLNSFKVEIQLARGHVESLEADLSAVPTTEEEKTVLAEMQKATAEGKTSTVPFADQPRVIRLDGYNNQIAIYCKQTADLEGILAQAGYAAFELPLFDPNTGEGVTEFEVLEIVKAFVEYAEGKGERLGG